MTVGWQWDESSHPYGALANSETRKAIAFNRDRHLLDLPLLHKPGTQWAYSGGATALLGEILERSSGQPLLELANQHLFGPLGFTDVTWRTGWRGRALAFSGLRLKPRELARIGRLMLDGGRWQRRSTPVHGAGAGSGGGDQRRALQPAGQRARVEQLVQGHRGCRQGLTLQYAPQRSSTSQQVSPGNDQPRHGLVGPRNNVKALRRNLTAEPKT